MFIYWGNLTFYIKKPSLWDHCLLEQTEKQEVSWWRTDVRQFPTRKRFSLLKEVIKKIKMDYKYVLVDRLLQEVASRIQQFAAEYTNAHAHEREE